MYNWSIEQGKLASELLSESWSIFLLKVETLLIGRGEIKGGEVDICFWDGDGEESVVGSGGSLG